MAVSSGAGDGVAIIAERLLCVVFGDAAGVATGVAAGVATGAGVAAGVEEGWDLAGCLAEAFGEGAAGLGVGLGVAVTLGVWLGDGFPTGDDVFLGAAAFDFGIGEAGVLAGVAFDFTAPGLPG